MSTGVASGDPGQGATGGSGAPTGDATITASGQQGNQAGNATADWTTGLSDELKGFVQTKNFKDPTAVLDSYRNLEKLMGAPKERLLKLPEKADDPAWGEVYSKLGRPADPKEYNFEVPQGGDPKLADWAKGTFHKLNMPKSMADNLAKEWNAMAAQVEAQQKEAYDNHVAQDTQALKKEWGAAHDQNTKIAEKAFRALGFKPEVADGLEKVIGHAETMKLFHALGTKLGEDNFQIGTGSNQNFGGAMTPAQAKDRISALRADPGFVSKYVNNDADARNEMARLHQFAYPSDG